jgi:hypothetical protein
MLYTSQVVTAVAGAENTNTAAAANADTSIR